MLNDMRLTCALVGISILLPVGTTLVRSMWAEAATLAVFGLIAVFTLHASYEDMRLREQRAPAPRKRR
ncbi:MAG: hypothetical protein A3I44_02950 [Candidatus Sungbacteria bacterium RIFCSPLOWO2_02_FULL_51_17]|nr:MAG: hypothetical protein A2676_05940 [Candidatus Sungbacteria bacterium RIFCSPHIGHO2_01_FULL_51_22]OHA07153.1 MAG: hypothetical protein A3B29_05115 [Candidatus Sungbacteria bacterium RIFCSPLOWO2_01_FULL_51_34]OHA11868.1 MAG: hypothetical protein A3I44_02950 [Candidatus Sungbacteria bacterium RIFCSPLOWO2_02_FULL_51_17]